MYVYVYSACIDNFYCMNITLHMCICEYFMFNVVLTWLLLPTCRDAKWVSKPK